MQLKSTSRSAYLKSTMLTMTTHEMMPILGLVLRWDHTPTYTQPTTDSSSTSNAPTNWAQCLEHASGSGECQQQASRILQQSQPEQYTLSTAIPSLQLLWRTLESALLYSILKLEKLIFVKAKTVALSYPLSGWLLRASLFSEKSDVVRFYPLTSNQVYV